MSSPRQAKSPSHTVATGEVRIIAGRFRGRKLRFVPMQGLRPSGDRIRETVFSWLLPWLPSARVLDPFTGSGALAFEALSRGAGSVQCGDIQPDVIRMVQTQQQEWGANGLSIQRIDALTLLQSADGAFDIIFLDPPFRAGWIEKILPVIFQRQLVKPDGVIYLEMESDVPPPALPENWYWHREKMAGQVRYGLLRMKLSDDRE